MQLTKQDKLVIGIVTGFVAVGIIYSLLKWLKVKDGLTKISPNKIFLGGGLDDTYSSSYKPITEQLELVKVGSGSLPVQGFGYRRYNELIESIRSSNEDVFVVLFSKSAQYSNLVAKTMLEKGYDLKNLFIVEPYAGKTSADSQTTKNVRKALELGVPASNLLVGKTYSTGKGITENASSTPLCSPSHWCSLTEVGKIIKRSNYNTN